MVDLRTLNRRPLPFAALCLALLFVPLVAGRPGAAAAQGGPGVKTDLAIYPEPPPPPLPAAGGKFIDPTFGTEIMRVTDTQTALEARPAYSYWPSFNSNNTKLLVIAQLPGGADAVLVYDFDPVNFTLGSRFSIPHTPSGLPPRDDAIWSTTDPNVVYLHGADEARIWAFNVSDRTYTLVADLTSRLLPNGWYIWQMSKSDDNDVFAATVRGHNGETPYGYLGHIVYRASTDAVLHQGAATAERPIDECQVDKSGRYLYIQTGVQGIDKIYGRVIDLTTGVIGEVEDDEPDYASGHGDSGTGFYVGNSHYRNALVRSGHATPDFHTVVFDFLNSYDKVNHTSMLATNQEWGLWSFYGGPWPASDPRAYTGVFLRELVQIKLDGSQQVRRLAHHHSHYNEYYDSPFANISRDGRFVAFGSNWGNPDGRRDVFVVKIPPAPAAKSIQFSAAEYAAAESAESATLTVTRTGDTSAAAAVNYRTVPDSRGDIACADNTTLPAVASERCDYVTWAGTLSFAPGEAQKSFTVPLVNDTYVEPDQRFEVLLEEPSGGSLGAQFYARVRITSEDASQAVTNPLDSGHGFFVRQHYLDFLGREPDAPGFGAWTGVLNNCPNPYNMDPNGASAWCDRVTVSSAFFRSPEFEIKGGYVYRFYAVALGRRPVYTEMMIDLAAVAGSTPAEVFQRKAAYAAAFERRPDFKALYDARTSQQYVDDLMNRHGLQQVTTPDPQQPDGETKVTLTRQQLAGQLAAGTLTRGRVLRAVADSDEVKAAEFNRAFVAMQFYGYLRRAPEEGGYNAWLGYLNSHPGDFYTMVHGFLYSEEYRRRFGLN